mmetsp:Transcript_20759/g.60394  ORF Transcript_20759/g.60394 Transcript_20759/m.60394 type:complete len:296 (+) Transcript_20759:125-1012(+)
MNVVIFYLQCIGFVPNLQCPRLMRDHCLKPEKRSNSIDGLNTGFVYSRAVNNASVWNLPTKLSRLSSTALLSGFFVFYVKVFPHYSAVVSIRLGRCALLKTTFESARWWRLAIEDPFEIYSSHRPHDLGMHLEERGHKLVMDCLKRGMHVTTSVMCSLDPKHGMQGITKIGKLLVAQNEVHQQKGREQQGRKKVAELSDESFPSKMHYYNHKECDVSDQRSHRPSSEMKYGQGRQSLQKSEGMMPTASNKESSQDETGGHVMRHKQQRGPRSNKHKKSVPPKKQASRQGQGKVNV